MENQRTEIQKGFIMIIVIVITMLVLGCLSEEPPDKTLENDKNNTVIKYSEKKIIDYRYKVTAKELESNAKVPFEIGQRFVYKTTPATAEQRIFGESIFTVEGIEKIDKKECYVVYKNYTEIYVDPFGKDKKRHWDIWYYYDKENGDIIAVKDGSYLIRGGEAELRAIDNSMFAPYMLALTDDFKWEQDVYSNLSDIGIEGHDKIEYKVVGREKINNRECFKVECVYFLQRYGGNKIDHKEIFWVDVEKRILIKKDYYSKGNLRISETNLVSGL